MELSGSSFRLQGGRSFSKVGRSNSSILLSESVTAECARIAGYERLSESMRLDTDLDRFEIRHGGNRGWTRGRVASFLNRVFTFGKALGHDGGRRRRPEAEGCGTTEEVRKRSSWLPDPDRRWPVQGW